MNSKLFLFIILSVFSGLLQAQTISGYMPYHQYLLSQHGNIQKQNSNARGIVFDKIGFSHYAFAAGAGWTPADSGVFNYSKDFRTVWETGAIYYTFQAPTNWVTSALDTFSVSGIDTGAVSSMTHQVFTGSNPVNSYMYSYTYYTSANPGYLNTETYQTWNGSAWVDSIEYTYAYDGSNRLTSLVVQKGNPLVNDSQYLYTYNGYNNTRILTQVWSGGAWVNAFQQTNNFDAHGNNYQGFVSAWNGSGWVNYSLIFKGYDLNNNMVSYTYELWNAIAGGYINNYQEIYQNTLGNVTQFENYTWDTATSAWAPLLLNTYAYDENHNLLYEQDQAYSTADTFANTDLYYYYYSSFNVSGINNLQEVAGLNIYPNPSTGSNVVLSFTADNAMPVSIKMYDAQGKLLRNLQTNVSAGANQITLNLLGVAPGSYFVQITDNTGKTGVLKLVKH